MGTEMRAERLILTDGVLHEGTTVVHLRVDDLTATPGALIEGFLVNMHDLVPSSHEVLLLESLGEGCDVVTDDVLGANLGVVDGVESCGNGHCYLILFT